jgi:hypothetical protein
MRDEKTAEVMASIMTLYLEAFSQAPRASPSAWLNLRLGSMADFAVDIRMSA